MTLALLAIFVAAFSFGTAEFVIAGLLPEVATGLGISIPVAGYIVTGYAIGIALGGPLIALATQRLSRKTLLVGICAVFTIGQVLCALAPSFEVLLAARVLVAAVHGTYFGIAAIVAISIVPEDKRGSAVALMLAGLTVSNILGVPGGTAVGNLFGWRATFWAVGALAFVSTVALLILLPRTAGAATPKGDLGREFRVLGRQQVLTSLVIAILVMIGQYSLFTYISPLLREVSGIAPDIVPWVLLLFGVGATLGVFFGGRLADWKLMPSLIAIHAVQALSFIAIYFLAPYPIAIAIVAFIWGGANFAFGAPLQARILEWTADAPNLASSLIPTFFNIGIAIGAVLGSSFLEAGLGYRALPWIGAVTMTLALATAITSMILEKRSGRTAPQPAGNPAAA